MTLYLLPGMGGDERLFERFNIEGMKKVVLKWKRPQKAKNLREYAREMAEEIDTSEPFALMGCSMGGMVAVEMSKFLQPENVILISSAKTRKELPRLIRFWSYFPLYRLVPSRWLLALSGRSADRMGLNTPEGRQLFRDMLKKNGAGYLKKAIHFVVNWDNTEVPKNYIHIHGTADKVLPYRYVAESHAVDEGSHFMVLTKGEEMSRRIAEILKG